MAKNVSANSLANLRKPKQKKEGYGHKYSIPQEKIDELFVCVAEGLPLKKAADRVGICFDTAKKYFEKGDSRRGIKPLKYRLEVFQDRSFEKLNVICQEQRSKHLRTVCELIDKVENGLLGYSYIDDEGNEVKIDGQLGNLKVSDYERLVKLQMFLMGGVTSPETESTTKILTAEQIAGN